MIPGPTAFVMALVLSGLPVHSFTFRGFPPRKTVGRHKFLEIDKAAPHTLIYYESPYRLVDFLRDALDVLGDRPAAVANDLTKLFEKIERGTLSSLVESMAHTKLKGEYIITIAGAETGSKQHHAQVEEAENASEHQLNDAE
jgi:16S rRNA (cytidine1402-2'-O)-methyltransferase